MGGMDQAFRAHLESGVTTLARCWTIRRADGVEYGFTDHDRDLSFDGITFRADSGLTAQALQQTTGLSVDNTEAVGILSSAAISEADIEAGRFDGAEVRAWLVNWADVSVRWLQFRGTLGEIRRAGGAFHAELRGLTEALNRPLGRVYQKPCTAVLGDGACRVDLSAPGYSCEEVVVEAEAARIFRWDAFPGFDEGWFARGRLSVLSGAAEGLWGTIKRDRRVEGRREVELWQPIPAPIAPGDRVRLEAGCDKRFETCRLKFDNVLNFQGFPDIPGEDWMMAVPKSGDANTGGSRR
ncbi:DUF2163 domain-containing protein [Jhaorihella thermophila]|uniref:Bacteriophage phiJL001 Gp84 C-terminal domain-containing protein n=1 Tax=Jhaorihella thermophila TaxID=488547 RepID=A0A1H5X266_9RHOB|nr:DUF2163 domain-containing protein [Jhaorihella thermophila]SEG05934.1 phage conserved hypothetical protein BR0599 [Jhaorihella thermophila]